MKKIDRLEAVSKRQRLCIARDLVSASLIAIGLVLAASAVNTTVSSATSWLAFAQ
jgi:hypothetical protein